MKFFEIEKNGDKEYLKFNGNYVTTEQVCYVWIAVIVILGILDLWVHL